MCMYCENGTKQEDGSIHFVREEFQNGTYQYLKLFLDKDVDVWKWLLVKQIDEDEITSYYKNFVNFCTQYYTFACFNCGKELQWHKLPPALDEKREVKMKRLNQIRYSMNDGYLKAQKKFGELVKEHFDNEKLIWGMFLDWLDNDVICLTEEQEVAVKWLISGGYKYVSKKPGYVICEYITAKEVHENTFSKYHPICGCLIDLPIEEGESLFLKNLV